MTDEKTENSAEAPALPDRLSTNPASPFHNAELLERGVGVMFNGVDRNNVEEYCVSEGWVRLTAGTARDRAGNLVTVKLSGTVEVYLRNDAKSDGQEAGEQGGAE
jgi:hypothetical protein